MGRQCSARRLVRESRLPLVGFFLGIRSGANSGVTSPEKYRKWQRIFNQRVAIDLRLILLSSALAPFCRGLRPGDTVYIHNRPEFVISIAEVCRRKGIKIVLHMHNSHLLAVPSAYHRLLDVDGVVFFSQFLKSEAEKCTAWFPRHVSNPEWSRRDIFLSRAGRAFEQWTQAGRAVCGSIRFQTRAYTCSSTRCGCWRKNRRLWDWTHCRRYGVWIEQDLALR